MLLAVGVAVVGLAIAYWVSPFRDMAHASEAARLVRDAASRWWLPPLLLLAYTPGSFILFPRQVITISAAVAFGPGLATLLALSATSSPRRSAIRAAGAAPATWCAASRGRSSTG